MLWFLFAFALREMHDKCFGSTSRVVFILHSIVRRRQNSFWFVCCDYICMRLVCIIMIIIIICEAKGFHDIHICILLVVLVVKICSGSFVSICALKIL